MKRTLEPHELIERSIIKKFRKTIWNPFTLAVRQYQLVQPGDKIAVCISGGKDSMLMAKLMQLLQRYSEVPFEVVFLVMDPGYNEINRSKIESNAAMLHIPITVFETDVFAVANNSEKNPCYLCARMRRGYLYSKAQSLDCNKIALGHHFNDVIETTVMSMFYGSQMQAMLPKLHSTNFAGMELIRPLYCVHEEDIIAWKQYNELEFIQCACRFTENCTMCDNQAPGGQDPAAPSAPRQPRHRAQHLQQHPRGQSGHDARLQDRRCAAFLSRQLRRTRKEKLKKAKPTV